MTYLAARAVAVMVTDIRKVLQSLSLRNVTLVGHSMGAAVALWHTARPGSRVGTSTRIFHALNDKILPFDHGQALAAGVEKTRGWSPSLTADTGRRRRAGQLQHGDRRPADHGRTRPDTTDATANGERSRPAPIQLNPMT